MIESRQGSRYFDLGLAPLNPYGVLTITFVLIVFVSALPLYAQEEENSSPLLTYGRTVSGTLDDGNPRDVYAFNGLRGEVIALNLRAIEGDLDPVLAVLDEQGTVLALRDDGAGGRDAGVAFLNIPGSERYTVVVGRFGFGLGSTAGEYELGIERVGVSSQEGSMLRYGDSVSNTILNTKPQVYYTFRAERGDIVDIDMQRQSGSLDPYVQVVNSQAFVIADNDDLFGADPFSVRNASIENLLIEESGVYIIIASRYGQAAGDSVGTFVLSLMESTDSGLGNSVRAPIRILQGSLIEGVLTNREYEKYYSFEARRNDIITIRMDRVGGALDAFVVLTDAGLQELAFDDDSGDSKNARIEEYLIPADGTYYVLATRFEREEGQTSGRYRLELQSLGNAFDAVEEGVQRISYGTTVTGRIDDETPEMLYAFWGVEGDTITVSMSRGDGDLDSAVSILNSDQRLLVGDDDSGGGQNARVQRYRIPSTGVYYVRTARFSGQDGDVSTQGSFVLVLARVFN